MLWSMDRSLQQIIEQLESARLCLMELHLSEPQDETSSTTSLLEAQEADPSCYVCEKATYSSNHSISSGSSSNRSGLSYLPALFEGTRWQVQSNRLPASCRKQSSVLRNQSTSLPPFQLLEPEEPELLQNLEALSHLPPQNYFTDSMFEPLNACTQEEKTKNKRRHRNLLVVDHGTTSVLSERPRLPEWALSQLSLLSKGKLEGHMSRKVRTLQEQSVPVPAKKSWAMLNYLIKVSGEVSELEDPQTQLSTLIHQNTEQNISNKSPDHPAFQLHVDTGIESGLKRTETKISHTLTSREQLQYGNDPKILRSKPLVPSVGIPPPRHLGVNITQEETASPKGSKHVLHLSTEQSSIGLSETRIEQHNTQAANMELTSGLPYKGTENIKITPLALLQVMDSMGMIPEAPPEMTESVDLVPNQIVKPVEIMETAHKTLKLPKQVTESVEITEKTQQRVVQPNRMGSRLKQDIDNVKTTPTAMLQVMDSKRKTNESHPCITEPVRMTPRPPCQAMESVKMKTLLDTMMPQHTVTGTVEMAPGPKHNVMESVNMTSRSQSQSMEQVKLTIDLIHQNTESVKMISTPLHQVTEHMKITPVALSQTKSFREIPPVQSHEIGSGALSQGIPSQVANLTSKPTQPDGLTSPPSDLPIAIAPLVVQSVSLPPESPPKVMEPTRKILTPSWQPIPLNINSAVLASPLVLITESQSKIVKSEGLSPQSISLGKESLGLTSGLKTEMRDPLGLAPSYHQGTESVSLASGLPHQIPEYSMVHSKQSHKVTETVGLTSDTGLQVKKSVQLTQSHHQIMEPLETISGQDQVGQDTESTGICQKPLHQVTQSAVRTTTSLLQGVKYVGVEPILQFKLTDSTKLSPGLQNVKSKNLTVGPELQNMKSVDTITGLDPQMVNYEQPIPRMKSIDLAPEFQQQSVKSEGLAPIPQLQSRKSTDSIPSSQFQGLQCLRLALPPECQHIKTVELTFKSPLEESKSVELASKSWLQNTSLGEVDLVPLLKETKTPQRIECRRLTPEKQVQSMKFGESALGTHLEPVKYKELNPDQYHHATEPEGLTPQKQASESLGMTSDLGLQETVAKLTPDTCHQVEASDELTQSSLGITAVSLSQTSESIKMSPSLLQDTTGTVLSSVRAIGLTPESQHTVKQSLGLIPGSEVQSVKSGVLTLESQPQGMIFVHPKVEPCSKVTTLLKGPLKSDTKDTETVQLSFPQVDKTHEAIQKPHSETGSLELTLGPVTQHEKLGSLLQNLKSVDLTAGSSPLVVKATELITVPKPDFIALTSGPQLQKGKSRKTDPEPHLQDAKCVNSIPQLRTEEVEPKKPKAEATLQSVLLEELTIELKSVDLNLHPEQSNVKSGLTPGPQLQSVRFSTLSPRSVQGEKAADLISGPPQSMKYSELPQEPQPEDTKPGEQTIVSRPRGLKSQKVLSKPQPEDTKPVDQTTVSRPQGLKSQKLISEPQPEDTKPVDQTTVSRPQGLKSQKLISEPQPEDTKPVDQTTVSRPRDLKSQKLISEPQPEDTKPVEQTTVSRPQGLKSQKLISEPQPEDTKPVDQTTVSRPRGLKSQKLISEPQPEDTKPVESTPKPNLEVKSMVLSRVPQSGSMKAEELAPGSEFQGLKSELMPLRSQLKDKKSVILTLGPCLKGLKSMDLTCNLQLEDAKSVEVTPGSRIKDLGIELVPSTKDQNLRVMELKFGQGKDSIAFPPDPLLQVVKPMEILQRPQIQSIKSEELISEPQMQDMTLMSITPFTKLQNIKSVEDTPDPQLQCEKSVRFASRLKGQEAKSVNVTRRQEFQGVKSTDLDPKRFQGVTPVSLTLDPGQDSQVFVNLPGWKNVNLEQLKRGFHSDSRMSLELVPEPKCKDIKSVPFNKTQLKDLALFELTPEQNVKAKALKYEAQLQSRISSKLTPRPQLQDRKSVELKKEQPIRNMKTIQWLSRPKSEHATSVGLSLRSKSQGINPTELKSAIQSRSMKSSELTLGPKLQGPKSTEFNPKSQLQSVKTFKWSQGKRLQNQKTFESNSEPPIGGGKTVELNKEPQLGNMKSLQWIPGPEFQGLNLKTQSQGVKPTELKSLTYSGGLKSSELSRGPKVQGTKSIELDVQQVQCGETPELFPGSELQKRENFRLTPEPQLQGRKSAETYQGPQLGSMKSIERIPGPDFQVIKSGPECRSMKSLDPTSRSKLCDVKSMVFKSQLHLQNVKSAEFMPGLQLQMKHLESSPGTQLQGMKSLVFMQQPQLQEVKSRLLSQRPLLQNGEIVDLNTLLGLKSMKSSELALQTEPQSMKSKKFDSGSQWQSPVCSKLTPEANSEYIKCIQLSSCSQVKGMPLSDLTMENKIQGVKPTDFKPQPQTQDIKSSESIPRTKLQETKLTEFDSGPQLQDVKSSKLITGIKLQDTESMNFSSKPYTQGVKSSKMILGETLQGVKCAEINSSPKLSDEESDLTLGREFSGMKSGQHFKSVKSVEVAPEIKHQGVKIVDFNSGPQIQSQESSELAQRTNIQDVNSVEFNCGPKLQGVTSVLLPKTNLEGEESAKFNSDSYLQDMKYSKLISETDFKDTKSIGFGSIPYLQGVKSDIIPETKLQKEKSVGIKMPQLLQQDVKYCQLTLSKVQDRKSLGSNSAPPLRNRKLSMLTPQINDEYMKSMEFNPSTNLQDMKAESINLPIVNYTENNDGSELQVAKLSSELNAGNQHQGKKSQKLEQWLQFESEKFTVFNSGPHLQHVKSSKLCPRIKIQDAFTSEKQPGDVRSSELCLGTKLLGMQSSEFNLGPQLERIKSFDLCKENKLPDNQSLEFKHKYELQGRKSSQLNPRPEIQCKNCMTFNIESQLQDVKSSELKPTTEFQDTKSKVLCLGPHLQGINFSASIPGLKPQCVNSVGCNPEPHLNDVDSSACTPGPRLQCMHSTRFNSEPHSKDVNSSAWTSGAKPQYVNSTGCNLKPHVKEIDSSTSSARPKIQYINSTGCNSESYFQGVNSACTPGAKSQCVNSTGCNPGPLLQDVNSFASSSGLKPHCTNSTGCNPGPCLQDVTTQPSSEAKPPCANCTGCNPWPHLQGINTCASSPGPKPQWTNSTGCEPGIQFQSMNICPSSSEPKPQCVNSTGCNVGLYMQDATLPELTPVLELRGVKSCELNSRTQIQSKTSVVVNSEPHFQGMKSSELTPGTKCQVQFSENQLQWEQQVVQPVFKSGPSFNDLKPVVGIPDPLLSDVKSEEMRKQPSLSGVDPVKLTSGSGLQDLKYGVFALEKLSFQDLQSMELSMGSQQKGINSQELNLGWKDGKSLVLAPEPPRKFLPGPALSSVKFSNLFPESQQQGMNPLEVTPEPKLQIVKHAKLSSLSLQQIAKPVELAPRALPQKVQSGNQCLRTSYQITESSELTSSPCLQNMKSNKLSTNPTHQTLETMELKGFQIVKTMLIPGPLFQTVKSEELATGPIPQFVEPIGVATRLGIELMDCFDLTTRPNLQELVKPVELMPTLNIQVNSAELTSQQTPSFEGPTVLTQLVKSIGITKEPLKVMENKGLTQGQVYQNEDSEELTSEELQIKNYFSQFPYNPSASLISSSATTDESEELQDSGIPKVWRAWDMKNLGIDILENEDSYIDPFMIQSSTFPLDLHNQPSDKPVNSVETLNPEILAVAIMSKERNTRNQIEESEDSLQSYSQHLLPTWRSGSFQAGPRAQRGSIQSFLGRQQNAWESHAYRQRLPRKYLSSMLMLGNVLGSTMERKLCSRTCLVKRSGADIGQSVQNLFGVPAELMEFSQSLLEKSPATVSKPSVFKNYIQRHTSCHDHEKGMGLKMWTRGFTSSIIQQYSGTRFIIKKANSKLRDKSQEVTQYRPGSYVGGWFPTLVESESSLRIFHNKEDLTPCESPSNSQARIDNLWSNENYNLQQKSGDDHLPSDSKRERMPVVRQRATSPITKHEDILWGETDPWRSSQQPKTDRLSHSRPPQYDSQTRTFEPLHSSKPTYLSQAKSDFSEQSHLLQDLQLKIAAKLLRSQIPPNVPPPLASGLVLKYPICLQCGQCSGLNCNHSTSHTSSRSYILIYPQLHLVSTPEGHGKVRLRLGFRLRTGKRHHISKYHGRDKHTKLRSPVSSSRKKAKIYPPASKGVGPTTDFRSGSSQPPAPFEVHIKRKQRSSPESVRKTEIGEGEHYKFPKVHSLSESDSESSHDENFTKARTEKSPDSKYPMKRIIKGPRSQNTKFHTYSPSRDLSATLRRKRIRAAQISTASLKRPPKKSSHPKFLRLLFQGLKQVFQTAHRILPFVGQKPEDRTKIDDLWSSENCSSQQKSRDYHLPRGSKRERIPVVKQRSTSPITKQEDIFWRETNQGRSAQQSKRDSFSHPKSTASQTGVSVYPTLVTQDLGIGQDVSGSSAKRSFHRDETSSQESINLPKPGARFQAQRGKLPCSLGKKTLQSHLRDKDTHKVETLHRSYRDRTRQNSCVRSQGSPSQRLHCGLSEDHLPSPLEKRRRRPSERTSHSLSEKRQRRHRTSERRYRSPSQRGGRNSSQRDRSSSQRGRSPSQRAGRSPSQRGGHSPSQRAGRSPSQRAGRSPSQRAGRSSSQRAGRRPSRRRGRSPSQRRDHSALEKQRHRPSDRRQRSASERSRGSLSETTNTRHPSERKGHSSGTAHRSPSERSRHSPSKRAHLRSPEGTRHSHSERRHRSRSRADKTHDSPPQERLKDSSPTERPQESFQSYSNVSKKAQSRTRLEA
ncbi:spermatogenesis-associated protein 31H1 isoform X2 [Cavia porcellus]